MGEEVVLTSWIFCVSDTIMVRSPVPHYYNYAGLNYTTQHYTVLQFTTLYNTALYYTILHNTTLCYNSLLFTTLQYTTQHYPHYPKVGYTWLKFTLLQPSTLFATFNQIIYF